MTVGKAERVGVLRGATSPTDEALIADILEDLGLSVVFQSLVLPPAPLRSIESPEDFVLKEHFEAFREHSRSELSRRVSARAFNQLVDARSSQQLAAARRWDRETNRSVYTGEPTPYAGLIVAERTDIGFEPYPSNTQISYRSRELARFAMQAGSLVSIRPHIEEGFVSAPVQDFVLSLIDQVDQQISA